MPAIQFLTSADTAQAQATAEASGAKVQKLQGLQGAFSNYMRQSSTNTAQMAKGQTAMPQAKIAVNDGGAKQQYEQYQGKAAVQAERIAEGGETANVDADTVKDAMEQTAENVKEAVKENLGVDDEQLEAAMEALGLVATDLLDPQQLIALAVELTGSEDAGMMLFQENFQTLMQEVATLTNDLLQELGMSMEELMAKIHTTLEETEQPIGTMLPDGQQAAGSAQVQAAGIPQEAQVQAAEIPQDTVREKAPQREAVQVGQFQNQKETVERPQDAKPVQEEAQAQETTRVQGTQPKQEEEQADTGQTAQKNPADTWDGNSQTQETTHFDFHANVHQQEPSANVQTPQDLTAEAPLPQVNMQDVIDQIVEYTRVNLSQDVKSIEMQLNPENLGKVYLHVSEKQGTVTAQLTAQNENIKEALVQQAAILKDTLNQQGIKVDAVEVSAGAHEFESNLERDARGQEEQARQQEEQSNRRSRRSINLNDLNELDGLSGMMSEEETLVAQIMRDNGNNVDYKA